MKKIDSFVHEGASLQPAPPDFKENDKNICVFEANEEQGKNKDNKSFKFALDEELLSQHLMFLGGIGTGKTNAICQAISQFQDNLTEKDIMIIFDAKGDYYKEFYREGIDVVISNDDTCIGVDGEKDYWNIFNEVECGEHMEENLLEISSTLFNEKLSKSKDPFFPTAAKDLFYATMQYCCRDETGKKYDNHELRQIFDASSITDIVENIKKHPDLKAIGDYLGYGTSNTALGILGELQQVVRAVFVGNFKKDGNLSMRKLVRAKGGRIIFIEYDLGIGHMLSPIYSLLFDLAMKEALCRTKSEGNVYFIADEFKLLPHLQHVDDAVNFGRSLGVKFLRAYLISS